MKEKIKEILSKIKFRKGANKERKEKVEITFFQSWVRTLLIALALVIIIFLTVMVTLNNYTRHGERYVLSSFVGLDVPTAELSDSINLRFDVTDSIYVETLSPGEIIEQRPKAGSFVKSGRRITLKINTYRPKNVTIPYVAGFSLRQAINKLRDNNIEVEKIIYQKDIATNNILRQEYNGKAIKSSSNISAPVFSKVTLYAGLSDMDAQLTVPQLVGRKYVDIVNDMQKEGFNIEIVQSESLNRGYLNSCYIDGQTPLAGRSVRWGTTIKLKLINDQDEAIRTLREIEKIDKEIAKVQTQIEDNMLKDSIRSLEKAKQDSISMSNTFDWVINNMQSDSIAVDSVAVDTINYKAAIQELENILDSLNTERAKF